MQSEGRISRTVLAEDAPEYTNRVGGQKNLAFPKMRQGVELGLPPARNTCRTIMLALPSPSLPILPKMHQHARKGCRQNALTLLAEDAPGSGAGVAAGAVLKHCAVLLSGKQAHLWVTQRLVAADAARRPAMNPHNRQSSSSSSSMLAPMQRPAQPSRTARDARTCPMNS